MVLRNLDPIATYETEEPCTTCRQTLILKADERHREEERENRDINAKRDALLEDQRQLSGTELA